MGLAVSTIGSLGLYCWAVELVLVVLVLVELALLGRGVCTGGVSTGAGCVSTYGVSTIVS